MRPTTISLSLSVALLLGAIPPFVGPDRGHARQVATHARSARGGALSGALIWVPDPGYYYGTSVQYYPHVRDLGWRPAKSAAESPRAAVMPRSTGAPESIHSDLYWRPRAWGDTEAYQAWHHGEMWRQALARQSTATVGGECAKCQGR